MPDERVQIARPDPWLRLLNDPFDSAAAFQPGADGTEVVAVSAGTEAVERESVALVDLDRSWGDTEK